MTSESANQPNIRKKRELSRTSAYDSEERNGGKINSGVFPELTVSPLRRFQLIDSDSDDSPVKKKTTKEEPYVNLSTKENQSTSTHFASSLGTETPSVGKYQTRDEDLWKDFCTEKSPRIPTPAFDEICNEYFSSAKKTPEVNHRQTYSQSIKMKAASNHTEWLPPAHHYFFHEDPRIQKLVRDRLPNFLPLFKGNSQIGSQQNASGIDYM